MREIRTSRGRTKRFRDPGTQMSLPIPGRAGNQNPTDLFRENLARRLPAFGDRENDAPSSASEPSKKNRPGTQEEEPNDFNGKTRKMEAMGILASGIAHDFNNILTPIFLRTEMAMAQLDQDSPLRYQLEQVLACGQRARDLVQQILNFSRQNDRERKPLQISLVVKELLKLLRSSLPATIEIRQDIMGSGMVLADLGLIHLLVTELCTGSVGQTADKGGVLEVSLRDVELDGQGTAPLVPLPKGAYVKLSVRRQTNSIFSQRSGQAVVGEEEGGWQISLIRNIVDHHGGGIVVYREADKSMACDVFLPRMEGRFKSSGAEPLCLPRGTERVLLVDDEKDVLETLKQMLAYLGYKVFSTTGGPDALEVFRMAPDQFDLLITDQTMPKITGLQLAAEVNRIRPELPILLCSGYGDIIQSEEARKVGVQEVVMKPLTASEMAHKVRQVLKRAHREQGPLKGG